jgi:hypothetical protein
MVESCKIKRAALFMRLFSVKVDPLGQRITDLAERIADLGTQQPHDGNYDDGDEGEYDGILDQPLTFFLWSK